MKTKYTLFRRNGIYYSQDSATGQQKSLRTRDETEALKLINARNEAHRQPVLNLHLARAYPDSWREGQRPWCHTCVTAATGIPPLLTDGQGLHPPAPAAGRNRPVANSLTLGSWEMDKIKFRVAGCRLKVRPVSI
ncbi:MAG TPA: hypothetical protein VMV89_01345 [Candidatus Paceibacterota bacterium]|nr:hypothetical protein [Candidatus Paceibacterota bacterium]